MTEKTNGSTQPVEPKNQTSAEDLEALRQLMAEETKKRETAESAVVETNQKLTTAYDAQIAAHKQAIANGISGAEAEIAASEAALAKAHEIADYAGIAKATSAISRASARLEGLNGQKAQAEVYEQQWKAQALAEAEAAKKRQSDPLSQYSAASREWIKTHPRFLTDEAYRNRVASAHYKALAEKIPEGAPAYYDFIETEIDSGTPPPVQDQDADGELHEVRFGEDQDLGNDPVSSAANTQPNVSRETPTTKPRMKQQNTMAAPVSRSVPSQAGGRKSDSVTLNQRQMDAARVSFPDEYREDPKKAYALYAQEVRRLEQEGKEGFTRRMN